MAEALKQLPLVVRALTAGEISWSAARELMRVATKTTEGEWLAVGQRMAVRELEALVFVGSFGAARSGARGAERAQRQGGAAAQAQRQKSSRGLPRGHAPGESSGPGSASGHHDANHTTRSNRSRAA